MFVTTAEHLSLYLGNKEGTLDLRICFIFCVNIMTKIMTTVKDKPRGGKEERRVTVTVDGAEFCFETKLCQLIKVR